MKPFKIVARVTNRDLNTFNQYLKDIALIKLLTATEEISLAERIKNGDKEALDELILRNLRFVVSVAKSYTTQPELLQDLINEGNIGMIKAAKKFDYTKGFRFISYAVFDIRKAITEFLSKSSKTIRLPANKIHDISKLNKRISKLEQEECRTIDINDLIYSFDGEIDEDAIFNLKTLSSFSINSMDASVSSNESDTTMGDLMTDNSASPTDYLVVDYKKQNNLTEIINSLNPREKEVITRLFGFDGNEAQQLIDVGLEMGISRETVRQIKEKVFIKIQSRLKTC